MVLFSRVRAPKWNGDEIPEREAKCRKLPPPRYRADPYFDNEDAAMRVCNGGDAGADYVNAGKPCPLRDECLVFALINHESHGVWGGMLLHDRMTMKRSMPRRWWYWHPPTPKPEKEPSSGAEDSSPLAA
jgi:hypothetical protein